MGRVIPDSVQGLFLAVCSAAILALLRGIIGGARGQTRVGSIHGKPLTYCATSVALEKALLHLDSASLTSSALGTTGFIATRAEAVLAQWLLPTALFTATMVSTQASKSARSVV